MGYVQVPHTLSLLPLYREKKEYRKDIFSRMRFHIFLFITLLSFVFSERSSASCGSATCPLNSYHSIKSGWVGLNIVHEYIDQNQIYVGSSKSFVGAIPEHHDEVRTLNERNVLRM